MQKFENETDKLIVDTRPPNDNIFDQHPSSDIIFNLNNFEGSIEFLVYIVKSNGYDIHTVKISSITDQFLKYMQNLNDLDLDKASDFLVMAATLLEIKAKASLPKEEIEEEIEDDSIDTEEELRRRMIEYQMFKDKAESMKEKETLNRFFREPEYDDDDARISIKSFNLDRLMEAYAQVLFKFSKIDELSPVKTIEKDEYTVADKIEYIVSELIAKNKITFYGLFDELYSKNEIINTFLALLQIVGKQFAKINQNDYGDITIELADECNVNEFDYNTLAMNEEAVNNG